MSRRFRYLAAALSAVAILAGSVPAVAQPKDQDKQSTKSEKKAKKREHKSGKRMLGDRIRRNGTQKLEDHGKFSASADVENGKVRGVRVKHADRGDVKVTKYKTNKDMSNASLDVDNGVVFAQYQVVATVWIGFAYLDEYGYEVIYWFPVDLVVDGDYGAVYYYEDEYYG